jgi:tight adherence protein B
MLDTELMQMGLGLLVALSAAAAIYFIIASFMSGDTAEKRLQGVAETKGARVPKGSQTELAQNRRKQVADSLKEMEARQKEKEKVTLRLRLERAGLEITPQAFWIASGVSGLFVGVLAYFALPGTHPIVSVLAAFAGAFGLPRFVVAQMAKRRQAKFVAEFANSIDVIVRGVKSGLPLNECLGIIGRESPSPIREEFREIVEQQRVGIPLSECFERMMARVPLPEVKFFSIVIGIQQQAGGNLSEALGNLSGVLRDRRRLQAKVKALSAEAKASAAVLGALPFIVMTMVYVTTPNYIALLWTTKMGQFLLLIAGAWMTVGLLVMRKMINFKY